MTATPDTAGARQARAAGSMAGLEGLAEHYDLVIVGAGLSGAVFAEQAASRFGMSSLIIDKRDHIGASPPPERRCNGASGYPAPCAGCGCVASAPAAAYCGSRRDANPVPERQCAALRRAWPLILAAGAQAATALTSSTSTASA